MTAPIVIRGTVTGSEAVQRKLTITAPNTARQRMRLTVRRLTYMLEREVRSNQLNGGVLNRRSGRLARSINSTFADTTNSTTGSVGTPLLYGRIWELTGSRAYIILPRNKRALAWPGGRHPVASAFHPAQAPRPFLKPALHRMRPLIRTELDAAMRNL